MAGVNLPNVEGMNQTELLNAVGKMTKELSWLLSNLDWKNINELNIQLNGGATVNINDTGITINDGTVDTFKADIDGKVTMTGATVQSKYGYPKVVMDPDTDLLGAYLDADNYIRIIPDYGGAPAFEIWSGGILKGRMNTLFGALALEGYNGLVVSSYGETDLSSADYVRVPQSDWSGIKNSVGLPLQDAFDNISDELVSKATSGISTGLSGSANGGIAPGTVLMVSGGGTVTWTGIPLHSHAQS